MAAWWPKAGSVTVGHAEEKSSGDNRFSLPVALEREELLSSLPLALPSTTAGQ